MPDKPRWISLQAEGKQVVLLGRESRWVVCECATEAEAAHKVRELWAWSKQDREAMDYRSLCQAGG